MSVLRTELQDAVILVLGTQYYSLIDESIARNHHIYD